MAWTILGQTIEPDDIPDVPVRHQVPYLLWVMSAAAGRAGAGMRPEPDQARAGQRPDRPPPGLRFLK